MSPRLLRNTFACLLAAPLCAGAQPKPAQLQPAASEIVFTTRQMGVPVDGRFTRFTAQIALDARQPDRGSVVLTIDAASARFGSPELDGEVPKAGWLDVARFPQAQFQSTGIKAVAPDRFDVAGKLTLKGTTRDIVVPVTLAKSVASGQFTIKRLDFRIGDAEWSDTSLLAGDVEVRFKLTLSGLAP